MTLAETETLSVCYNFNCKTRGEVQPTQADIEFFEKLFHNVTSAEEERKNISFSIANMEKISARYLPTGNDLGGNYTPDMPEEGKQDCIDESTNTTTYLNYFQKHGWLHWHIVGERVHRAPYLFDDHWAAQILENKTGAIFVVDSWYRDNGQPAVIQSYEDWKNEQDIDKQ